TPQIARDAEVARIHAEEEIQGMIDSLDKSNETVAKYLQEYQQFASDLSLEKKIELINDLVKYQEHYTKVYKFQSQQRKPMSKKQKREYYMAKRIEDFTPMGSKEEAERAKRKGIILEKEQVKKQKSSEEAPKSKTPTEEVSEDKIKEIMQLVPVEDVYVQALQVKHPIIDWKRRPMTKKQKKEYYMVVIKSNLGWRFKDFKGMTFEEIEAKFAEVWKQVEDFIPMGSKEETERLKRKGLNLEKEQVKKQKSSQEAPEIETSTEEFTEEKMKEMMQLVPVEDVYVQALQVKHPIIDWKVHTEGQRSYWQIIRLGGSSACYQFFVDLLKQLEREDLNQLWALVKEYLSIRPATNDKEMELWVELKRMYEPDPEDQLKSIKFRGGLLGIKCTRHSHCQGRQEESQAKVYHIDLEHAYKVLSIHDDEPKPVELKEVIKLVTTAKLMTKVVTVATTIIVAHIIATTITAAPSAAKRRKGVVIRDPEETATPSTIVHSEPKSKDKGKGIMVQEPKPLKKQAQIEQDEAYARELEVELNKNINWDDVIEQVKKKGKQDNVVLRYQVLKRKPQTKAQARNNMIVYLNNMAGFKMDYFKGMSYDDIRPIFEKYFNSKVALLVKSKEQLEEEESRALKRTSESLEEKAAVTPLFVKKTLCHNLGVSSKHS
nr:hypothetical protein [Tanacetum cinerariifolium]